MKSLTRSGWMGWGGGGGGGGDNFDSGGSTRGAFVCFPGRPGQLSKTV